MWGMEELQYVQSSHYITAQRDRPRRKSRKTTTRNAAIATTTRPNYDRPGNPPFLRLANFPTRANNGSPFLRVANFPTRARDKRTLITVRKLKAAPEQARFRDCARRTGRLPRVNKSEHCRPGLVSS